MQPLVSVIIPTYNRAQYLVGALESVLSQTYKHMEIIVVDDGSTDNTRDVLEKWLGNIRYIHLNRVERSKARNEGFVRSRGAYVAFLDSDDLWHPEKIGKQVEVLEENEGVGLVYTDIELIDSGGKPYSGQISMNGLERTRQSLYEDLMTHNVISGSASSVMGRRACFVHGGLFDETMTACEDLDLWRRLSMHYQFYRIDLPLVKLRVHINNTQHQLIEMAHGYEKIIEKILAETPPEYEYYKNEAIIKLLSHIWDLYRDGGKIRSFSFHCGKIFIHNVNLFLAVSFWKDFLDAVMKKWKSGMMGRHCNVKR